MDGADIVSVTGPITVEEFLESRFDLPEGGQWSELEAGEVVHLNPPDVDHGTVVLNLSKAFAECVHSSDHGYACFDLGLQLTGEPDTVRFPAACFFEAGPRFAESDREATTTVPTLVVELASTADRQRMQPQRSLQFLAWGVRTVWTIHPQQRTVRIFKSDQPDRTLAGSEWLTGESALANFRIQVSALFAEPSWWLGKSGTSQ